MKQKRISFYLGKKKFNLNIHSCNFFEKGIGLMFKRKKTAEALLFEITNPAEVPITSYFVFFSFIAIWLDKNNKVMEMKKIKPFTSNIIPKTPFTRLARLIEIPINSKYEKIVGLLQA